ncbi:MAG: starch-binding protein [Ruminococcaceae bacterium]|nr:starch-binding protein [Oscillospiraceae bacterium]
MRKVISLVLVILMAVSLFVPMLSVSAETNEETDATVSTYNLVALMNRGDKLLEEYDFTEESLESYQKAYDKAMKVLFYGNTQEEIDSAKAELESAINALSAQIETTTVSAPIYRLAGDVNEDSKVNVRDATAIQKHLANIITLSSIGVALADANGDGKLSIKDATEVQKFIAGLTISDVIGEEIEVKPEFTEATKPQKTEATTLNTDATEKVDVTTEASLPTTAPVITTEPAEVLPTDATEVTEVTEATTVEATENTEVTDTSIHTDPAENEEEVADGVISFTLAEEFRVEYYGSEKTELYLVKSREEMASVIAKIQSSIYSSLYTTPTISEKYNDEFFENNALIISLNCVGGSNCYQTIDSLNLDGDTLTVCRTLYKPDIVLTDMNYRYALLEVSANAVKNVKNLEDNTTYATIGDDVTVPDKYEEEIAIYFTNTQNWSKVYIHFWGGEYDTIWPGAEMDFVENNPYGQDVYKAYIPADTTGIVFSAGANMPQTVDIITDISDGCGFYPTETTNNKWNVNSYIFEDKNEEESTVATKPDEVVTTATVPETTVPKDNGYYDNPIAFSVKEECRVEYYGSDDSKLYIVRNVAEFNAVLDTIQGSFGDYYKKPTISDEYDDLYFMSDALVISLSCVGGSNCYQTIDGISVTGNTLTLHRSLYKPDIVLCDMNYQYVLIEVNVNEVMGVQTAVYNNTHVLITE